MTSRKLRLFWPVSLLLVGMACLVPGSPPVLGAVPPVHSLAAGVIGQDDDDDEEMARKGPRLPAGKDLGLALTFERDKIRDTRPARMVALEVPEGTAPTPFLSPGPFRATWEGDLNAPWRGEYTLFAVGRGTIHATLNGKDALQGSGDDFATIAGTPIKLKRGANKLVVIYDSPEAGAAEIRLSWSSEDFRREPVSTSAYTRDSQIATLAEGTKLREGRLLMAELRCLNCHAPDTPIESPGRMPELNTDAPSLANVGSRLNPDWMARWIADPHALRPTATMPKVVHGPQAAAQSRDLAAYLATLGSRTDPIAAPDSDLVATGGRLFGNLGCVGCHTLPDRDDWRDDPKRVPLRFVGAKWQAAALIEFLLDPSHHYAWIKMPNFHFTRAEAEAVAAYVQSPPVADLGGDKSTAKGDAGRGKTLFASVGCASCHAVEQGQPSPTSGGTKAMALSTITSDGWLRGCVLSTEDPSRKAPDYRMPIESADALRALANLGLDSLTRDAAPEFVERQVKAASCNACHKRDGYEDVWSDHKVEVDKLLLNPPANDRDPDGLPYPADQSRPSLTWTGEKLYTPWAETFIAGNLDYKPRPYLRARMPAFAPRAQGLAEGFTLSHGYPIAGPPATQPDAELIPVAKELVGNKGLNCVSCHNIGAVPAVGVFEAPGINFMHVRERIRPDYFDRWVRSPIRVEPETKMPTYFNGDASVLPTILGGKAEPQIEALWNYILQGRQIEPPGK